MKKLYIFAFIFLVFIIATLFFVNNKEDEILQVKKTYSTSMLVSNSFLKEVNTEDDKSKILVYYPETSFSILNDNINNLVKDYVTAFKTEVNSLQDAPRKSELSINFDSYEYKDYISYAFYTTSDVLKAHPDYYIDTINYDIKNNKIITIDDLVKENPNILNVLSKYTYEKLLEEPNIKEYGDLILLKNGTSPKKENFRNFVFTTTGLIIFFEKYSVGPYVLGEFSVNVPYNKLI